MDVETNDGCSPIEFLLFPYKLMFNFITQKYNIILKKASNKGCDRENYCTHLRK